MIPQCAVSPTLYTDAKGEQWDCTAVVPAQHAAQQALNNTSEIATRSVGVVYDAVMELHLRQGKIDSSKLTCSHRQVQVKEVTILRILCTLAEHLEHPNRVRELNRQLQVDGLLERCRKLAPKPVRQCLVARR